MNKRKMLIPLLSCFVLLGVTSCGEEPVDPTKETKPITSIRLSRQNLGLVLAPEYDDDGNETGNVVGEEFQLEVSSLPRQANKPVIKFSSTDEKVATVDENGLVKAVGDGRCDIVASNEDGTVSRKCPVYVGTSSTKSKVKKVAEDIKAAQADITVDTVWESVYWNNKRTKNDVVFEDTYFDRTMVISKSQAYFYLFRRYLREPANERVVFALERPGVGNDRHPGRPIELHAVNLRSPVAEKMDVRRKVELPVDSLILEEDVCDRIEVVVPRNDHELDVGVRRRPFPELLVDPLLLVIDMPRPATAQRSDVACEDDDIRPLGVKSLKVAVQV